MFDFAGIIKKLPFIIILVLIPLAGSADVLKPIKEGGKCYEPDCKHYQALMNTLDRAIDDGNAAKVRYRYLLDLEKKHKEVLQDNFDITEDQLDRALLTWQSVKVLRSVAKGAWEAAMFLSGDHEGVAEIVSKAFKQMVGSDETKDARYRKAAMLRDLVRGKLSGEGVKQEVIARIKAGLKEKLEGEGYSSGVAQGVADGLITQLTKIAEQSNSKMDLADIVAQSINGYVQGQNEERKRRIETLQGESISANNALNEAIRRIGALQRLLDRTVALLQKMEASKRQIQNEAETCRFEAAKPCWKAYELALQKSRKTYQATLEQLQRAEKSKKTELKKHQDKAQELRKGLIAAYKKIDQLLSQNKNKVAQYKQVKNEYETSKEMLKKTADAISEANQKKEAVQPLSDLYSKWWSDVQKQKVKFLSLKSEVEPVLNQVKALRAKADKDFLELKQVERQVQTLEKALDVLRKENQKEIKKAEQQQEAAAKYAREQLDACLKHAYAKGSGSLIYTVARDPKIGGGEQGNMRGDAQADNLFQSAKSGYDAVLQSLKQKQKWRVEVVCPKDDNSSVSGVGPCQTNLDALKEVDMNVIKMLPKGDKEITVEHLERLLKAYDSYYKNVADTLDDQAFCMEKKDQALRARIRGYLFNSLSTTSFYSGYIGLTKNVANYVRQIDWELKGLIAALKAKGWFYPINDLPFGLVIESSKYKSPLEAHNKSGFDLSTLDIRMLEVQALIGGYHRERNVYILLTKRFTFLQKELKNTVNGLASWERIEQSLDNILSSFEAGIHLLPKDFDVDGNPLPTPIPSWYYEKYDNLIEESGAYTAILPPAATDFSFYMSALKHISWPGVSIKKPKPNYNMPSALEPTASQMIMTPPPPKRFSGD